MAESQLFDVPMIGQANSKICWLACYQMLYAWKKRSRTEPWERARRSGLATNDALYADQFAKARDAMWLESYRVGYLKESAENLLSILNSHGPMWCVGDFLQGSGHAIVISGYEGEKLRINDPYEIYKYSSYSWMTWSGWRKLVKDTVAACQVWP